MESKTHLGVILACEWAFFSGRGGGGGTGFACYTETDSRKTILDGFCTAPTSGRLTSGTHICPHSRLLLFLLLFMSTSLLDTLQFRKRLSHHCSTYQRCRRIGRKQGPLPRASLCPPPPTPPFENPIFDGNDERYMTLFYCTVSK